MEKHTYIFIKEFIEKDGYKLLADNYINAHSDMEMMCPNNHLFKLSWNKWVKGRRCKYCNKSIYIEDIRKTLKDEGYELISSIYVNSKSKLDMICPLGHEISISWAHWKNGVRCKRCYTESLKVNVNVVKQLLSSIGYTLLSDEKDFKDSQSFISCLCNKGHKFTVKWSVFRRTDRCPVCNLAERNEKFRKDFSNIQQSFEKEGYRLISTHYINAFNKLKYICTNGHEYTIRWNDWQQGQRCPYCSKNYSKGEEEVYDFLSRYFGNIYKRSRSVISPYELDMVIPSVKTAIEYCGLYWHSERNNKDKFYHLNKLLECEKLGYRLITIFEDEWVLKNEIVKNRLKHIFNIFDGEVVYGRNCEIKVIDADAKNNFLNENHLQGSDISRIRLGAFYKNELVAVMTFSKPSIAKGIKNPREGLFELSRYCCKSNFRVIGGASKLFKYFMVNYKPHSLISYADRRWSVGNLYEKLGFEFYGYTEPGYWYTKDGVHRIHRFNLRKACSDDATKTENELRLSEGYYRIWDCGHFRFRYINE